jgi:hypothetical protein
MTLYSRSNLTSGQAPGTHGLAGLSSSRLKPVCDAIMLVASALRRSMRSNTQPVGNLVVALVTTLETCIGAFRGVEEDGEHGHVLGASRRRAHSYAAGR